LVGKFGIMGPIMPFLFSFFFVGFEIDVLYANSEQVDANFEMSSVGL